MSHLAVIRALKELEQDAINLYNSREKRKASPSEIAEALGRVYALQDAVRLVTREWGNVRS